MFAGTNESSCLTFILPASVLPNLKNKLKILSFKLLFQLFQVITHSWWHVTSCILLITNTVFFIFPVWIHHYIAIRQRYKKRGFHKNGSDQPSCWSMMPWNAVSVVSSPVLDQSLYVWLICLNHWGLIRLTLRLNTCQYGLTKSVIFSLCSRCVSCSVCVL